MEEPGPDVPNVLGLPPAHLAGDPLSDGTLDTPNCPSCLQRMEVASTAVGGVHWLCPDCGQTSVG